MFDRKRPYNELPKLPPKIDFDDVEVLKLVNKANIALSSFNGTAKLLPNRSIIIEPLSVKEAVASSGVENINTTAADVFRAELFPQKEATPAQKETINYKESLVAGWRKVSERGFLTTNDFIDLQAHFEPEKSGIRRKDKVKEPVCIKNSSTGEIIYTPPEGEDLLRDLLKNYEDYFNDCSDADGVDPLIKLALLHYQFEAIHPFEDGNGRTGRILMVLYLVLCARIDLPMLFISGYILRNRAEYYERLRCVTENGEWKEWVLYILDAVIKQSGASEKTVLAIKDLIARYKKHALEHSLPNSSHVVDYLFSRPFYTYKDMAQKAKVHRNTAATYLNSLEKAGILHKTKFRREVLFYHPKFLELL